MSTDTRQALLPCPFCGHDSPSFERMGTSRQSCIVECGNCGCRHESGDEGPHSGSSWNERAALSAQPVAGAVREWDEFGRTNAGDETGGAVQRFGFDISKPKPEIIPATCGAFVYYVDYLALHRKLSAQAAPAPEPSAQAVKRPEFECASQYATKRGLAVTRDWIRGWDACTDYVEEVLGIAPKAAQEPRDA